MPAPGVQDFRLIAPLQHREGGTRGFRRSDANYHAASGGHR
jgi:hypothetical protein